LLSEWPRTPEDALAAQDRLRPLLDLTDPGPATPATVAGLDVAYAEGGAVAGAVVVLDATTQRVVDQAVSLGEATFPYVPGLFAFRELPALLRALDKLTIRPELLICDGQGIAHPRRFGLACHLGVLTGLPAIGVAKTPLVGAWDEPEPERGSWSALVDTGQTVGRVLRTQTGVKPVFVSVGHRISLDNACAQVLAEATKYRLPEPIRAADHLSRTSLGRPAPPDEE
jgi:deoxyribonuclease V